MTSNLLRRALAVAGAALIISTTVVFADNVNVNGISATTISTGNTATADYRIVATGGGGTEPAGCNVDSTHAATVTFSITGGPSGGVTYSPTAGLSFTQCQESGNQHEQTVTFTGVSAGTYTVTPVATGGKSGSTWGLAGGTFALTVNAPPPSDSTAPTITPNVVGTLGLNGWYTSDVTVSWTVVDGESPVTSSSGCGSTTLTSETTGVTLTCSATSAGGTNSQSVTIKIDKTGPTGVALTPTGTSGSNGWYTSNVSVSASGSDPISDNVACTVDGSASPELLSSETIGITVNGECTNGAGLSTAASAITIKIDKTGPTGVVLTPTGTAGNNGWYTSSVSVGASGTDAISDNVQCTVDAGVNPKVFSSDTDGTSVNGECTNGAGLSTAASSISLKIDTTNPSATITSPTATNYLVGSTVLADFGCSDATSPGSGLFGCVGTVADGAAITTTPGGHTFSVTATDYAGNTGSASVTYGALYAFNGFLSPVDNAPTLNTAKAGQTIPLKWQLSDANGFVGDLSIINLTARGGIACSTVPTAGTDAIETYSTGATSLRYDSTANQYIFNWQTVKLWAGSCGKVTLTYGDGTTHDAYFQFK